ncbi:hypothetical protein J6590_099695, partial [Homalodisca vitripennis]
LKPTYLTVVPEPLTLNILFSAELWGQIFEADIVCINASQGQHKHSVVCLNDQRIILKIAIKLF